LRRGPQKSSDEEDDRAPSPSPVKKEKKDKGEKKDKKKDKDAEGNFQDMNIGQLINNIEKLLGSEEK